MATVKTKFESVINKDRIVKVRVGAIFELTVHDGNLKEAFRDIDQIEEAIDQYAETIDWTTNLVLKD